MEPTISPCHPLTVEELAQLYVLDSLMGFGPQKFKQLHEAGIPVSEAVKNPELIPVPGKRGDPIRKQLSEMSTALKESCRIRAEKQLATAESNRSFILTYSNPSYPKQLFNSNNPIPILYVRGNTHLLQTQKTVACVGSRKIREPYIGLHKAFVSQACEEGFAIVSGFALGADTVGHTTAVDANGSTICVMPCGLDRPFPPENKEVWLRFLSEESAVFVSEFPFGTRAASLNLRKRNKLISALALGVLVSQSSAEGGAMNAYRFAAEQKKPIATFSDDGTEDTSGNRVIASAEKPKSTVFNHEKEGYVTWLRLLSSSI